MADLNRPGGPTPDLLDMVGVVRPRTGPAGVSRAGGVQGTAPDAGMPRPPAPPAVNGAFPGAPAGPTPPPAPTAGAPPSPAPQPTGPTPTGQPVGGAAPIRITIPQGPASSQPEAPGSPSTGAPAAPSAPAGVQFPRLPRRREVLNLPPGTQATTPYGPVVVNPDGSASVHLTPEGKVLYGQEKVAMESRFGSHPFAGDPNMPKYNFEPGRTWYNPFSGQFGE